VLLVPVEVILWPTNVILHARETQQFNAKVPGTTAGVADGIMWSLAPTWGTIDASNGVYRAPDEVTDDREIEVIATSTIDPHESAKATVHLLSKPLRAAGVFGLFVYLVAVFGLVVPLVYLWPDVAASPSIVDRARAARIAADAAVEKSRDAEAKAIATLQEAQAQLSANPDDVSLRKKQEEAASSATKSGQDRAAAKQAAEDAVNKERELADPRVKVFSVSISRDVDLIWLVLITGALGSFVYTARSFVDFVGNKSIRASWGIWYLLYPLIGSALALVFYLAIRGGFLTAATTGADVNLYGLVAISGLVGMFSKQATNKLSELFSTLFKTDKADKDLKDKLKNG
jgi:hypothetical protein